ncbi:GTPase family protein [Archangium lansingense]|uniref:50S ribosome-binding GTPase n=1 Tax=Archangium lansingense TaxID=2995310 RepID=A0ABT4ACU5_9BACT|nr:GTPase [Archangium lansinium]MCY1079500.1 50S ribosome-binding GTPase [Archangium lansinium]
MAAPNEPSFLEISETVRRLEELLDRVPDPLARDIRQKIAHLRALLLEQRSPNLVLVGRRGAGKSSLINALFGSHVAEVGHVKAQTGQGRWFDVQGELGTLSILDTRGIQEGSRPEEADSADTPLDSILAEVRRKAPDALLFLIKASEVDSAIDADLDVLVQIASAVEQAHGLRPPLIGVATHCDLLEPKRTDLHLPDSQDPAELQEKLRHVEVVERQLREKLRSREQLRGELVTVLGVSTYLSWRQDGTIRSDERWRLGELAQVLFRELPEQGRLVLARVTRVRTLQEELATTLTRAMASLCMGVAVVPIPVADIIPITSAQLSLIAGIGWISGRQLDLKTSGEFLTALGVNVGAAFALREAARALIKFVFPGAGNVVSGAVAFAGTLAIGTAARAYFLRGVSPEEAHRLYQATRSSAEAHPERALSEG